MQSSSNRNSRCAVCPQTHRCVRGHGPRNATVMLVGERPGYGEDYGGVPLSGQTGAELNDNYLHLAGLTRTLEEGLPWGENDVYFVNTVLCRSTNTTVKPTKKEVEVCGRHHLPGDVEYASPAVIVMMGGTACGLVGNPSINLDTEHGIPRWVEKCEYFGDWSGWVVPMYHPSAGMHNTSLMIPLLEDWENLGKWLKGTWARPEPVKPVKVMRRLTTEQQVVDAIHRRAKDYRFLPTDTESDEDRPFSIQFSPNPEEGYMILTEDRQAVQVFGVHLAFEWNNRMLMHHALHDLDELERHYGWGGIEVEDTMIDAYHLGNLPQGLKALTYRLTGVRMTSYEDVVVPASKEALSDWLSEAIALVSTEWTMERHKQLKTKVRIEHIKHPSETVLRRILRFVWPEADSESEYDPWQEPKKLGTPDEEIRLIGREWMESLEARVGRMPRKSIIHATLPRAIEYGCSDAIYTGHCAIRMKERRQMQQRRWEQEIAEEDVDQVAEGAGSAVKVIYA